MAEGAAGDLSFLNRLEPENEEVLEDLSNMETALHHLKAAARITETQWEPLQD